MKVKQSKFRFVEAKPSKTNFADLRVGSPSAPSPCISASAAFIAVPWGPITQGDISILPLDPAGFDCHAMNVGNIVSV
jgi:hypothetical protein